MALSREDSLVALGTVTGATGALVGGQGMTSARNGAGDYTITLSEALDANEGICIASSRGAVGLIGTVVHTSDTAKQVLLTSNAGAATDGNFDFLALRFAP